MKYLLATSSIVEENVIVGDNTKVWYFSHLMEGSRIGSDCVIGEGCFIGKNVLIGDNCKIGNESQIVEGVILKNNIRLGLGVKFTNVRKPSAKKKGKKLDTIVDDDVTIESGAIIQGGVKITKGVIVGAGAVVIENLLERGFYVGNPARLIKQKHEE